MDFLAEYGMFLAQAVTIVVAIVVVIGAIATGSQKHKKQGEGHIEVVNLSEEIEDIKDGMQKELYSEDEYKQMHKEKKKAEKAEQKERKKKLKEQAKARKEQEKQSKNKPSATATDNGGEQADESSADNSADNATKTVQKASGDGQAVTVSDSKDTDDKESHESDDDKKRIFVLDFDGDVEASAVENLREEISAIISSADEGDKVLLRLESPGGMVHAYGLAASQLTRIKAAKLELIIAVDQVAASGGYMMACVADRILAAPFAVVGSIGVVAEIPNFHRLLKHNKVDYEQHTAGEYKRTLTMFSENTEAARTKFKQELEETHVLFKDFIIENRPELDIEKVATGEHWYGIQALKLGLIDEVKTSDDYILQAASDHQVFMVCYEKKKPLAERLSFSIQSGVEKAMMSLWQKSIESGLFKR